ncbi:MAG: alpha/beta fold hydrolase [Nannocystaceae bacterium]
MSTPDLEAFTVSRDSLSLHAVRSRPRPDDVRPPLLFVHGYPDSHRTWDRQLAAFGGQRPVAAFDLRGTGRSDAPTEARGHRFDRHLADIDAVVDAVSGGRGRVHLIGHDWGGALAWLYASDPARAGRLASLTVLAAPHPDYLHELLRRRLARHTLGDLAFVARQLRRSWYMFAFQVPGVAERIWARDPAKIWINAHRASLSEAEAEAACDRETVLRDGTGLLGIYREAFRRRATLPPPPVEVPTALIVPDRDLALLPELYDNTGDHVRDLEVHHLDANHWVQMERPAEVNAILADFVARHDG